MPGGRNVPGPHRTVGTRNATCNDLTLTTNTPVIQPLSPNTPSPKRLKTSTPHLPYSPGELGKLAVKFSRALARLGWNRFVRKQRTHSSLKNNIHLLEHKAAPYLARLARHGVPAPSTAPPWTLAQKDQAVHRGPHPSAARHYAAFLLEDMYDYVHMGYWVVLPYSAIRSLPHLKLAPSGVIPQRERRPRPIMDYTYNQVNQGAAPVAPTQAMQFGHTLQRLLQRLAYCNPTHGPPLLAKLDLADGYYRIPLTPQAALELAVVLPSDGLQEPLIGLPLSLPMGWAESPPYFCAFTETCADLSNSQAHPPRPDHPLLPSTQSTPMTQHPRFHHNVILPKLRSDSSPPLSFTDVYIDDFMLLAQPPAHLPLMSHVLYSIMDVFHDDPNSPRRQVISQSKLDKGDAAWSTTKRFLGWDIDTHTMTIQLPPHRLTRLHTLIDTFLSRRRTSRKRWQRLLGELRSMATAIQGARFLFSILQHVLKDQKGPRLKLTALIKAALNDWKHLASTLHDVPVPICHVVPTAPHYLAATDASKQGMGGVWFPTNLTTDAQPCIWRYRFDDAIQSRLVSSDNVPGDITNSDLELAAFVTGAATCAQHAPDTPLHLSIATDNTPTAAWVKKGSPSSNTVTAFLLRHLAQQCRAHNLKIDAHYTPGATNHIADFCSRSFALSDMELLDYVNHNFPIQPSWRLVTPPVPLISGMNSALSKLMQPLVSPPNACTPLTPPGPSGQNFASAYTVTPTLPSSMIPSPSCKFLLTDTAWESWLPEGLLSVLEQWKEPFVLWDRRSPSWDTPILGSSHQGNWISDSTVNSPPTKKMTRRHTESNPSPYQSSCTQLHKATAPTYPRPPRSATCCSWASSSSSGPASMPAPTIPTPHPFASATHTSSSTPGVWTLPPALRQTSMPSRMSHWNSPHKRMGCVENWWGWAAPATPNAAPSVPWSTALNTYASIEPHQLCPSTATTTAPSGTLSTPPPSLVTCATQQLQSGRHLASQQPTSPSGPCDPPGPWPSSVPTWIRTASAS